MREASISPVRRALIGVAALMLILVFASDGYGVQYYAPASAGTTVNAGATNCFYESYGTEHNQCSTAQYWSFPLTLDQSYVGRYVGATVQVYAATTSATIGCYQYSVGWSGSESSTMYSSNTIYPQQFGTVWSVTPSSVYNPSNVVQVICVVNTNGTVNSLYTYISP